MESMRHAHIFDLPPEVIVRILKEFDEQSLGRLRLVARYLNAIIEKHRSALAKQSIYLAEFKENELVVERFLRRNRWEDYKYGITGRHIDSSVLRQLLCANIDTVRFQVELSDEAAVELAERINALKSSVYRVYFSRCHLSPQSMISLLAVLHPQQVTIEFESSEGFSMEALCQDVNFREIKNLNLINSHLTDGDLRLITAEQLTVYEKSNLTLNGLREILLEWYNGKRVIHDYHLSISERVVPESLFHGLPTRRRSVIAWELRNPNTVLHVSIIGSGISIVKVFNVMELN
ncbi:F-box domain protein [Trichostrongylus colubriformis]|uniref:F-box domain protein n=1 Tax=Trichostrongylus colubriformis TaxID=6319 RepID=A0AAN8F0K4_TRICO